MAAAAPPPPHVSSRPVFLGVPHPMGPGLDEVMSQESRPALVSRRGFHKATLSLTPPRRRHSRQGKGTWAGPNGVPLAPCGTPASLYLKGDCDEFPGRCQGRMAGNLSPVLKVASVPSVYGAGWGGLSARAKSCGTLPHPLYHPQTACAHIET